MSFIQSMRGFVNASGNMVLGVLDYAILRRTSVTRTCIMFAMLIVDARARTLQTIENLF